MARTARPCAPATYTALTTAVCAAGLLLAGCALVPSGEAPDVTDPPAASQSGNAVHADGVAEVSDAAADVTPAVSLEKTQPSPDAMPAVYDAAPVDEAATPVEDVPTWDPAAWTIEYIPGSGFTSNGGLSFIAPAAGVEVPAGYPGVEDPWVASGRYSTGDPELDEYTKAFCDAHTDPGMDFSDNAYYTYLPASWAEYIENDSNQNPQGPDWMYVYAKQYWHNSGGNCYEVAAAEAFILQYYGYDDAYAQPCLVNMQSGAWGDHSLVFVTNHTGVASLCDTSRGTNGWMLPANAYNYSVMDIGQPDLANAR